MALELAAIREALKWVSYNKIKEAVILTDSKAGLQSLKSSSKNWSFPIINGEIIELINKIQNDRKDIVLQWIPSHVGIEGNEKADGLAKNASGEHFFNIRDSLAAIKKRIQGQEMEELNEFFVKNCRNKIYRNFKKKIAKFSNFHKDRMLDPAIRIIFANRAYTNESKFIMKILDSPQCGACGQRDNVKHRILKCTRFGKERNILRKQLLEGEIPFKLTTILSGGPRGGLSPFLAFVQNSNMLGRI